MKEQRHLSAFLTVVVSLVCLLVGYWVGYDERRELVQLVTDNIEQEAQNYAAETESSLRMLELLREGGTSQVIELLTADVKRGLKPIQPIGHEVIDQWSGLRGPSEATLHKAFEYQEKYCSEKCLGL